MQEANKFFRSGIVLLLGSIVALYLLQLFSPIRVNYDAVRLLGMAWTGAQTGHLPAEQFPPVYPLFVTAMIKCGLTHYLWLVVLNYMALAGGLWCWARVARDEAGWSITEILTGCCLFLASWVVVKHAPIPLTDPLYFLLANAAVASAFQTNKRSWSARAVWWCFTLALTFLAISTRTIGISLLALLALLAGSQIAAALRANQTTANLRPFHRPWVIIASVLLLLAPAVWFLRVLIHGQLTQSGSYLNHWFAASHWHGVAPFLHSALLHVVELGQLLLNLPVRDGTAGLLLLSIAGLSAAGLVAAGAWRTRRRLLPIAGYVSAWAAILMVWPYHDPRFWFPLLPWAFLLACPSPTRQSKAGRRPLLPQIALGYYLLLGIAALGYSTRLTFAGRNFPSLYTRGNLLASYNAVLSPEASSADSVDPQATAILRHYIRPGDQGQ